MNEHVTVQLTNLLPGWVIRKVMQPRYERKIAGRGEPELRELPRIVRRDRLAIDVGSNLGVYTYALSRLTGRVMAFEPIPGLARLVRKQALPGVSVHTMALSSDEGEGQLSIPAIGAARASLRADTSLEEATNLKVQKRSLDSFHCDAPGFIKIDVEGHEEAVLHGAQATIARYKPRLLVEIEERHNPGGLDRIARGLAELGYVCVFLKDGQWQPLSLFRAERDQQADLINHPKPSQRYLNNFLFLPEEEPVQLVPG